MESRLRLVLIMDNKLLIPGIVSVDVIRKTERLGSWRTHTQDSRHSAQRKKDDIEIMAPHYPESIHLGVV